METMAIHLALNGAAVLMVSLLAGLFLYRSILSRGNVAGWHLLHAGGSGRAVLLIALAGIIQVVVLPPWQLEACAWLMIFFVWTSVVAMLIVAATGEHGFGWDGAFANKLAFALYAAGTAAVFPAAFLLIVGLLNAL